MHKKSIKKLRNPNIDFIRIIGMFSIIITHLLNHGGIAGKYRQYKDIILLNIFCMWHVSSLGVISGLAGNKTHKFSNLLYLWILTLFYSLLFYIKYNKIKSIFNDNNLVIHIFPVILNRYWYFTAYFAIYPFLPFINEGISILPRNNVKKSLYFIIGIFIIWASLYKIINTDTAFYTKLFIVSLTSSLNCGIGKILQSNRSYKDTCTFPSTTYQKLLSYLIILYQIFFVLINL